jgi:hypothetical protein
MSCGYGEDVEGKMEEVLEKYKMVQILIRRYREMEAALRLEIIERGDYTEEDLVGGILNGS